MKQAETPTATDLLPYFKVSELVCPHAFAKWGEGAARFLRPELVRVLMWIRREIGAPITVNASSKNYTQRGLRCNCCELVSTKKTVYLSAHILGAAVDFDVKGTPAETVRQWLKDNASRLPVPIRIESGTSWVHIDTLNTGTAPIEFFKG